MPSAVPPCFRRCRTLLTGGPSRLRDDRSALPCIAGALRRSLLTSAARAASWFGPEAPGAIPSSSSFRLAPAAGSLDRHATGTRPVHSPSLRDVRGVWARASRGVKHLDPGARRSGHAGVRRPEARRVHPGQRRTGDGLDAVDESTGPVSGCTGPPGKERSAPMQQTAVRAANAVAERVGFEPTKSFDSALFKSAAINRSATSPAVRIPRRSRSPGPPHPATGSRSGPLTGYPRATRRNSAHHLGGDAA